MSNVIPSVVNCPNCGKEFDALLLVSTNSFGPPDLDLRPAPMQRNTMEYWLQECPHCGLVFANTPFKEDVSNFIRTLKYKSCDNIKFADRISSNFYKLGSLYEFLECYEDAYYAFLHAAWACDDFETFEKSSICRKKALEMLEKSHVELDENLILQKADILRRAGLFDEVVMLLKDKVFNVALLNKIAKFQIDLSLRKDIDCYTVGDVD